MEDSLYALFCHLCCGNIDFAVMQSWSDEELRSYMLEATCLWGFACNFVNNILDSIIDRESSKSKRISSLSSFYEHKTTDVSGYHFISLARNKYIDIGKARCSLKLPDDLANSIGQLTELSRQVKCTNGLIPFEQAETMAKICTNIAQQTNAHKVENVIAASIPCPLFSEARLDPIQYAACLIYGIVQTVYKDRTFHTESGAKFKLTCDSDAKSVIVVFCHCNGANFATGTLRGVEQIKKSYPKCSSCNNMHSQRVEWDEDLDRYCRAMKFLKCVDSCLPKTKVFCLFGAILCIVDGDWTVSQNTTPSAVCFAPKIPLPVGKVTDWAVVALIDACEHASCQFDFSHLTDSNRYFLQTLETRVQSGKRGFFHFDDYFKEEIDNIKRQKRDENTRREEVLRCYKHFLPGAIDYICTYDESALQSLSQQYIALADIPPDSWNQFSAEDSENISLIVLVARMLQIVPRNGSILKHFFVSGNTNGGYSFKVFCAPSKKYLFEECNEAEWGVDNCSCIGGQDAATNILFHRQFKIFNKVMRWIKFVQSEDTKTFLASITKIDVTYLLSFIETFKNCRKQTKQVYGDPPYEIN